MGCKNLPLRKSQCATCVLRPESEGGGFHMSEERRNEIKDNLLNGINQICHTDNNTTICRGGRDYQLAMWHRLGLIEQPTNEALAAAMEAMGIEPAKHIKKGK